MKTFTCITCGARTEQRKRIPHPEAPGEHECPRCVHDRILESYRKVCSGQVGSRSGKAIRRRTGTS